MKQRSKAFIEESHMLRDFSKSIEKINRESGLELDVRTLYDWEEQIQNFEMVVMGMYNAGKSTLLNLLLDLDLDNGLPTGIRPTTNKLWKISYSNRPQLKAMRFGSSKEQFIIDKNLSNILDDLESNYSENEIETIDYYELGLPSEWLKRTGWAIWDTPGKDDLGGLLNEDHFERVLQSAEGAIVVTNYDQYKSCAEYLLQLKSKQIECVVIALTNSAARTPEEFAAAADRHLEQVTGYLQGFFPSARFDFAIDSKDPSGSVDRMQNRWVSSLWKIAANVERIEESLMMLKAWRSLEPAVNVVTDQLKQRITELQEKADAIHREISQIESKAAAPISCDVLQQLDVHILADHDARISHKCQNLRQRVETELSAAKHASNTGYAETAFKYLTFGFGGRNATRIDQDFSADFKNRLVQVGIEFIQEKVWKYIIPYITNAGTDAANQAIQAYTSSVETEHSLNYRPDLSHLSPDNLNDFAWEKYQTLETHFCVTGFRNNDVLKNQFLDLVESIGKEMFIKVIQHAAENMSADIQANYNQFQEQVSKSLREFIEGKIESVAEIDQYISKLQDNMNFLSKLNIQLNKSISRHQINNNH